MAAYNGEKYIREQIDSILAQQGVQVELVVRDDGSTDSTKSILDEYQAKGQLSWYTGENLRACRSFLHLLFNAPEREFYAFSDQDDYWHADKLITAVKKLEECGEEKAMLYFSAKNIVDEKLKPMNTADTAVHNVSYNAAVLNCVASGCTMVFNLEAKKLAASFMPEHATMHDAWIYRLVNAFGKVVYDSVPHIDYRQHGNNVVGADLSMKKRILAGIKSINERRKMTYRSEGAKEMYEAFGAKLNPEYRDLTKNLMEAPGSLKARLKLVFGSGLKAQSAAELMFIKCFILLGWI
mgnify:CR=1 FL=1